MNRIFNSTVFTDLFWRRPAIDRAWDLWPGGALEIKVVVPPTDRVVMVGSCEALGSWDPLHGVELLCEKLPSWYLPLDRLDLEQDTEFKFVIMRGDTVVAWENDGNRIWKCDQKTKYLDFGEFRGAPEYRERFAGVAIPLFSIRTKETEGIGDYPALGEFALWAASAGLRVVQILPINDTTSTHTWADSYPYSSISVFALHPLYIRVGMVDQTVDLTVLQKLEKAPKLNYDKVDQEKWRLLREIYARCGAKLLASEAFHEFYLHNELWIGQYAAFSFLRDKFGTVDYTQWPEPYNVYSVELFQKVLADNAQEIGLYYFLQYHADAQLRGACREAHSVGVALKGDIPIGVSRHSVQTWSNGDLFNLNGQAGAPPDEFSADGQNWGFPTYNWTAMAHEGYQWWRMRLEKMADYFDMYRIDHILGFFRIWEIPVPQTSAVMGHFSPALPYSAQELELLGLPMYEERYIGVDNTDPNTVYVRDHKNPRLYHPRIAAHFTDRYRGTLDWYEKERFNEIYREYFYHRNDQFWAGEAFRKLPPIINATSMLCCAEDLGMVPQSVASTLAALNIVTLEVERMPKQTGLSFGNTATYPYSSVATTSTHDMSPIRQWWREDRARTSRYYNQVLARSGEAPDGASDEICEQIIKNHLQSPSMAVIIPLQDWLAMDAHLRAVDPSTEQINDPSDPNHYWRYRMHRRVETLAAATSFNAHMRALIESTRTIL
ncbi:MAG: 4-alpha-glucanotransferase [Mucinivorans sp.]